VIIETRPALDISSLFTSQVSFGVRLPPWIFWQLPVGTKIQDLGSLARLASPAQEWLFEDAQSFLPAALMP
jgi:hypothetical protein